ncbi:hypothetical protein ACOME3_005837 [Neoechinorhynchus agilis]
MIFRPILFRLCHHRRLFATKLPSNIFGEHPKQSECKRSTINYGMATVITMLGVSCAVIPIYRYFCEAYGWEGVVKDRRDDTRATEKCKEKHPRKLRVELQSMTYGTLPWEFTPEQPSIEVSLGEAALCF